VSGEAADPTLAIAAYLKAQEPVWEASEERIFRPELPEGEDKKMPRACILVRPAGGGAMSARDYLPFIDSRLDLVCYGSTRLQAENIAREVALALKFLRRSKWKEIVLCWARVSSQPASAIDPNTNWPFALVSTQVYHASSVT
jgi:hypothetical protein